MQQISHSEKRNPWIRHFLQIALLGFTCMLSACLTHYPATTPSPSFAFNGVSAAYVSEQIAHNTEGYTYIEEEDFKNPQSTPYSTFSIDVDTASYANMRRFINQSQLPPEDAVRIEEFVNYFHYNYPEPQGSSLFSITTELGICPWKPSHQLVHIGLQGKSIPTEDLPANNLVFLLDVSGSMSANNKLPLLKRAFSQLVEQMRPQDTVAITVYAGAAGLVLPATSGNEKSTILEALDNLNAGGSTAGSEGIQLAYEIAKKNYIPNGNNRVILATDGDFNVGQTSDGALVRLIEKQRDTGVFLTVLGFGTGNYQDGKMQQLADKGNGNHAYIDSILEAKKVLISEFGGTLFTIAKDVKLQVEFNPAYVKGYRLIGYENRRLAAEDFNDDTKDAGELGSGHSVTALYEIIPADSTEALNGVKPLRYQSSEVPSEALMLNNEILTVEFRYKQPDASKSELISETLAATLTNQTESSENLRWSAAVTEYALILRDSKFKGNASYEQVLELAKDAQGVDLEGYRQEFIGLVKRAMALSD